MTSQQQQQQQQQEWMARVRSNATLSKTHDEESTCRFTHNQCEKELFSSEYLRIYAVFLIVVVVTTPKVSVALDLSWSVH
ncbi:hypothetical protein DD238_005005 [Peronospora effusa]|uniref:Uncharacterized protein n=1 Tax=Peronospora effusa TaxID=542832 RepID=A0A3M6VQW0_9STRA|nr:hypothetical protein DD238_005005 [Peronospora effusa]